MTTADHPSNTIDGLALLLGPRQAQIMRLLWACGSATAREIHTRLAQDSSVAYTTVTTICTRLTEMGLLLRQRVTESEGSSNDPRSYSYKPLVCEADFVRTEVSQQLDRLLEHFPAIVYEHLARSGQPRPLSESADDQPGSMNAPELIESLRARVEAAERRADAYAAEAERARQQAQSATRRAVIAERQVDEAQAEARRAHQRTLLIEEEAAAALLRSQLRRYSKAKPIVEYYDPSGICRVCGQEAAPIVKRRRDGLRLCGNAACVSEARRRDNLIKQRQFQDRQRLQRAKPDTPV